MRINGLNQRDSEYLLNELGEEDIRDLSEMIKDIKSISDREAVIESS